jgi:tetratricopeptide (TPR) repeat protein
VKKWVITIAAGVAFVAVGFTARWWVPQLKALLEGNHEAVSRLNDLTDLVWRIVGSVAGLVLFVYGLWQKKKETTKHGPAATVQQAQTVRDVIAAEEVRNTTYNAPVYFQAPSPPAPSPAAVFPSVHQLPPLPADFTGREEEIKELLTAVAVDGATIPGLQGQGGVGKTALALKLAEKLAPNFPDAQIYMDLLGVSRKPLAPGEAMAYVIRAFQPEAKLPENEQELAGIYQSVLHGKRALLLMDNARDAAQVKPLIPSAGCMLLVTSRFHFVLPGLQAVDLETLPPAKAEELLLKIAPRIGAEAQAIAKLCGYLPQALRLAATALAERANMAPSDYRQRLADEKNRPKLLAAGNESVEASISLSYGLLDAETQKRWRMLGVFPETFDGPAAASVWSAEKNSAEDTLGLLTQYSMLEWNEKARRYRLHDLMRDFAWQELADKERYEASLRHARHYLEVLRTAGDLYKKGGDSLMPGLSLFDLERGNIEAGQAWAMECAVNDSAAAGLCISYPGTGVYCLDLRHHPRDRIRWIEAGLAGARRLGDRAAEGVHLGSLGIAYRELGEYRRAIEYYERQLKIVHEIGDRQGEGNALGNLGNAYDGLTEYRRAIECHEQSLQILREIGDRRGEGGVLGNLGSAYQALGEHRRAIGYHEQRLQIAREVGDREGEGRALSNLGNAYFALGETRLAVEFDEHRLQIAREIGDRRGEGVALWNLSLTLDGLGERKEAIKLAEASLKIKEKIEDPSAPKVRKQLEEWRKS